MTMTKETPYSNSLFDQPWWLDIVAPGHWNEVFVNDDDGNVIARMPYVYNRRSIYMPKNTQNLGIWMDDSIKGDYAKMKDVIYKLVSQLPDKKSITYTLNPVNDYILPFRWKGFSYTPSFTYRIRDLSDMDYVYSRFSNSAKKNIRHAKNKVVINDELSVDHLFKLTDITYKHQHRSNPTNKVLDTRIMEECEASGHGKYMEAVDAEGNIHACTFFVYDENVCYDLLGGSDPLYRNSGAKSLILWEGIKFAADHSKIFDFEGSSIEGIENFFRQWGGVCTPLYTIRKVPLIEEVLLACKPRVKRLIGYKM